MSAAADSTASPGFRAPQATWLAFAWVALQFAAIVVVVERFALENEAFRNVFRLAYAGFLVHHLLPQRARQPFFVGLSFASIAWVLGTGAGGWDPASGLGRTALLVAIGGGLIGICHLPLTFFARAALLLAAGAGLALLRTGAWLDLGSAGAIWPILGAMFMFRIAVYLYDRENMKPKPGWGTALSYFFLIPNVCFPLFPVIDFKAFCRGSRDPSALYDTGLRWMLRGVLHLIGWRLVYYQLFVDPSHVTNGREMAQFLFSNMALYLRVSGQFHLVIGLLHMFGFALPETNRLYWLSSSFTDYWRRVNIYWKDFILKIVYYPTIFRVKHWGETRSVVFATAVAFALTWLLHSYQWFWLRGDFPITGKDALFWGALGLLVVYNSVRELRRGRKRTLGKRTLTWRQELALGAGTAATVGGMSALWTIWNSESLDHVVALWKLADLDTLWISAVVLAGLGAARVAVERWETRRSRPAPATTDARVGFAWRPAATFVLAPCLVLATLSLGRLHPLVGRDWTLVLESLADNVPNEADEEQMQAGYYEDLMDVRRFNSLLSEAYLSKPADWQLLENTPAIRELDDIRLKELVASSQLTVNGHAISTNRHGMRDREYTLEKPADTYRVALMGSSLVMGWGVDQDETFEGLLEERLNREGDLPRRVEILNFAVNGYTPLAQIPVLEQRVLRFSPDAIYLVGHFEDAFFVTNRLASAVRKGVPLDPFVANVVREAKVDAQTPHLWAAHRLDPHWPAMVEWATHRLGTLGREAGIELLWVYVPGVTEKPEQARERKDLMIGFARDAGFRILDLTGLYDGADQGALRVAAWDSHPNATAHRVIADRLYEALRAQPDLGLFQRPDALPSAPARASSR